MLLVLVGGIARTYQVCFFGIPLVCTAFAGIVPSHVAEVGGAERLYLPIGDAHILGIACNIHGTAGSPISMLPPHLDGHTLPIAENPGIKSQ